MTCGRKKVVGKVCFVFVDGIGIGPPGPDNPFSDPENTPFISGLVGGPMVSGVEVDRNDLLFKPIDACLGVESLPQSATGQTALFTGVNAPKLLGHHVPARPNSKLREVIDRESILKKAKDAGFKVLFANAFGDDYWDRIARLKRGHSASTLTALAAGLPLLSMSDLRQGKAVYWDITHEFAGPLLGRELPPPITPQEAGENLVGLVEEYDLVLFETFLTDLAGHKRLENIPVARILRILDSFLKSVVRNKPESATLVLSSDHGNLEDLSRKTHTRNPVPLLVVGPGVPCFREVTDITQVAPAILRTLKGECEDAEARK